MDSGWIKIHRKIMDWDWYTDDVTKSIYLHLLLTANYEKKSWRGITIEPGERVISINGLAEETQHSKQQTRTALDKLKATHEITLTPTHKYTIVKVLNYRLYQGLEELEQHSNQHTEQHSSNTVATRNATQSATTTKEIKNKELKNKEKEFKDISAPKQKAEQEKKVYGELDNVTLTDAEFDKLIARYGTDKTMKCIEYLSLYKSEKNYKTKSDYSTIIRWVANAVDEREGKNGKNPNPKKPQTEKDFFSGLSDWAKNYGGEEADGQEAVFGNGGGS